ncbi:endonuclease domain-containing protein [Oscillatoria amoena NRMC-F 0135]|nr:endonuclease domain-containing protein [Oscillatoria amoena NRMC-F 0135]
MNKKYDRWQWPRGKVPDGILTFARENRKRPTPAEKLLWSLLRNRKLGGFKFRRQQPIQHFIVDFFCEEARLIVEVDGEIHRFAKQMATDRGRTIFLEKYGLEVVRFSNHQVLNNTDNVLNEILKMIKSRLNPSPLSPLPGERGVRRTG